MSVIALGVGAALGAAAGAAGYKFLGDAIESMEPDHRMSKRKLLRATLIGAFSGAALGLLADETVIEHSNVRGDIHQSAPVQYAAKPELTVS